MVTLYFVPSYGRFLEGRVSLIERPTLHNIRAIIRDDPLAWVTA
jgi:hypothetical protein